MKKLCLSIFLLISSIFYAQLDQELVEELQNILDNSVENQGNNGVSAFLMTNNGQTWSGTAGVNHNNMPITDSTLFIGASTTKLNIACLMLLLAEENLVDLDAPWNLYTDLDLPFDNSITVRQLLNHTSGIADYLETGFSGPNITNDFNYFYTPQEILENIVPTAPLFTPGSSFQYTNSNYVLAAHLIESITGNPVHEELRSRIWQPLGMNHTYFGGYESYTEPTAGIWWNFGSGVTNYSNMPTTSMLSYAYGAGNIVTCPKDLTLFVSSVLDGLLLNPSSLSEMMNYSTYSFNSWTAGYGLGLHHFNASEDEVLGHDGYYANLTDAFRSSNCGFTLVTMTNTQTSWFGIFNPMYDAIINQCVVGDIDGLNSSTKLSIYPNPSNEQINIQGEKLMVAVSITDITGKIIQTAEPFAYYMKMKVDGTGVYFISVKFHDGTETKKKLIRQ